MRRNASWQSGPAARLLEEPEWYPPGPSGALTVLMARYILLHLAWALRGDQPPRFPPVREILSSLCQHRNPWENRAHSGVKTDRQRMRERRSARLPARPGHLLPTCHLLPTPRPWLLNTPLRMHPQSRCRNFLPPICQRSPRGLHAPHPPRRPCAICNRH